MARTRTVPSSVSNSATDRAGEKVRAFLRHDEGVSRDEAVEAVAVMGRYRDLHAYPMKKVTLGVQSMLLTATRDANVKPGQRFKRMDRIIDKLLRLPHMRLSQMDDIGGCRAVVPDLDAVSATAVRMMRNWRERAEMTDYIANPKDDGYRGIHIVHRRDGRLIEVQLRTPKQHEWAEAIEYYGPRLGFNLKDGEGPDDLREYFRLAAARLALEERGEPADEELEAFFADLRATVTHYFEGA